MEEMIHIRCSKDEQLLSQIEESYVSDCRTFRFIDTTVKNGQDVFFALNCLAYIPTAGSHHRNDEQLLISSN